MKKVFLILCAVIMVLSATLITPSDGWTGLNIGICLTIAVSLSIFLTYYFTTRKGDQAED